MSSVLLHLAMVSGFVLFMLSLISGFLQGVPVWTVLFRSIVVLCVGTVAIAAFFRHFNLILFRFLKQKLNERVSGDWDDEEEGAEE